MCFFPSLIWIREARSVLGWDAAVVPLHTSEWVVESDCLREEINLLAKRNGSFSPTNLPLSIRCVINGCGGSGGESEGGERNAKEQPQVFLEKYPESVPHATTPNRERGHGLEPHISSGCLLVCGVFFFFPFEIEVGFSRKEEQWIAAWAVGGGRVSG